MASKNTPKKSVKRTAAKAPKGKKAPPKPAPKPEINQSKPKSPVVYIMDILYKKDMMQVSGTGEDGTKRVLTMNLVNFDQAALSSDEQFLVYHIQEGGNAGVSYKYSLNVEELKSLKQIKEKLDKAQPPAQVVEPVAPVAPVVEEVKIGKVFNSPAPVVNHSNGNGAAEAGAAQSASRVHKAIEAKHTKIINVDRAGDKIKKLEGVVKKIQRDETYFQLEYDIPTAVEDECPNPSGLLWCFGFRMTLSCWVLPKKSLENPIITGLFDLWAKWGVKKHIIKYAEDQVGTIKAIALEKLQEEISAVEESFKTRMESSVQRLEKARKELEEKEKKETVSADEYAYYNNRRDNHVRVIISESTERLLNAAKCSELFELTSDVSHLIEALKQVIRVEAETFNWEMREKGARQSQLAPVIQ